MLEKTTNIALGIGVVGTVCVEKVPPPTPTPTPPTPTRPITMPPVPPPPPPRPEGTDYTFEYDVITPRSLFKPKTTIVRLAGGTCVRITEYHEVESTSEWLVLKLGPVPEREVVPLSECPEGV